MQERKAQLLHEEMTVTCQAKDQVQSTPGKNISGLEFPK